MRTRPYSQRLGGGEMYADMTLFSKIISAVLVKTLDKIKYCMIYIQLNNIMAHIF